MCAGTNSNAFTVMMSEASPMVYRFGLATFLRYYADLALT